MTPASCTMCKYYSPSLSPTSEQGICRRHPPTVFIMPNGIVSGWPSVRPQDWCAEGETGVSHDSVTAGRLLMDKKNGKH
jgi:hypothetical protein